MVCYFAVVAVIPLFAKLEQADQFSRVTTKYNLSSRYSRNAGRSVQDALHESYRLMDPRGTTRELARGLSETQQDDLIMATSSAIVKMYENMQANVGLTDTQLTVGAELRGGRVTYGGTDNSYNNFAEAEWSPDGNYFMTGYTDGTNTIHIYSFNQQRGEFTVTQEFSNDVASLPSAVDWSPDGRYFAAGVTNESSSTGFKIYRFYRGVASSICLGPNVPGLRGMAWSPQGVYVAYGSNPGTSYLKISKFSGSTLTEIASVVVGFVNNVSWSPDGQYIVCNGRLFSWRNETLALLQTFGGGTTGTYGADWSSDGKFLAYCGSSGTEPITVYRFDKQQLTSVATANRPAGMDTVDSLVWSSDHQYLAVGYKNGDWATGKIEILKFDGQQLTRLRNCALATSSGVTQVCWHPNGHHIATLCRGTANQVQLWWFEPAAPGQCAELYELAGCNRTAASGDSTGSVDWSPDSRYLLTAAGPGSVTSGNTLEVFRLAHCSLVKVAQYTRSKAGAYITAAKWHKSGKYIALSGINDNNNYNVQVLKFDGATLTELPGCNVAIYTGCNVVWHPSGQYLTVAGGYSVAYTYRFVNETLIAAGNATHDDNGNERYVTALAWHPAGSYLTIGNTYNTTPAPCNLRILEYSGSSFSQVTPGIYLHGNTENARVYRDAKWHPSGIYLAFSGHAGSPGETIGTRVIQFLYNVGSAIGFSDISTGIATVLDSYITSSGLDWSPTGSYLALANSGNGNPAARIYSFDSLRLQELTTRFADFGSTSVKAVAWSPDGNYIAACGNQTSVGSYQVKVYPLSGGLSLQSRQASAEFTESAFTTSLDTLADDIVAQSNAIVAQRQDMATDITGYQSLTWTASDIATGIPVNAFAWSPNGNYVALGTGGQIAGHHVRVYRHDGGGLTLINGGGVDLGITATVKDIAWHPQGNFIAVAASVTGDYTQSAGTIDQVRVFELKSTGLDEIVTASCDRSYAGTGPDVETIEAVEWSPDGKFLIAAGYGPLHQARIYGFDFQHTLSELSSTVIDFGNSSTVYDVAWHPGGQHLALTGSGGANQSKIRIHTFEQHDYSLDGYLTWTCTSGVFGLCDARYGVAWSPDGTKLTAVGGEAVTTTSFGAEVMTFDFTPTTSVLHYVASLDFVHGGTVASAMWSPDSQYLSLTGYTGSTGVNTRVLKLDAANQHFDEVTNAAISQDTVIPVCYGDVITLQHVATSKYLATSFSEWYGSLPPSDGTSFIKQAFGANAQSIRTKWIIKGAHADAGRWNCELGKPVRAGDWVRLEAVYNRGNLSADLLNTAGPVSSGSSYGRIDTRYQWTPGQGINSTRDNFQVSVVSGASGDQVFSGQTLNFMDISYSTSAYLYSQAVLYQTASGNGDYVQEVVVSSLVNSNNYWKIVAVDQQGYRDVVEGGLRGGAGRVVAYRPDGLALSIAGGTNSWGCGAQVKPLAFKSLKDYVREAYLPKDDITNGNLTLRVGDPLSGSTKAGTIYAADWSPDNRYVAMGFSNDSGGVSHVRIYSSDGVTLTEIPTAAVTFASAFTLTSVRWDPTGRYFATGSMTGPTTVNVYSFDGITSTLVATTTAVTCLYGNGGVVWHPSGRFLAVADLSADTLFLYTFNNVRDAEGLSLATSVVVGSDVDAVSWSPSGRYLAISNYLNGSVSGRIYQFDGKSTLTELPWCQVTNIGGYGTRSVAWNPVFEQYVAFSSYASGPDYTYLYRFDADSATLTLLDKPNVNTNDPHGMSWSPDGYYLAVASAVPTTNPGLFVFGLVNGRLNLVGQTDLAIALRSSRFNRTGTALLTGGADACRVHPLYYETLIQSNSNAIVNSVITCDRVLAASNGADLIVANSDALIGIDQFRTANSAAIACMAGDMYALRMGTPLVTKVFGANAISCDWSPNGRYVAVATTSDTALVDYGTTLRVYEFDGVNLTEMIGCRKVHGGNCYCVVWRPDGNYLALGGTNGTGDYDVRAYSFANRALTEVAQINFTGVAGWGEHLSWHPNGNFLAIGRSTVDNQVQIYSFNGTALTPVTSIAHGAQVTSVAWHKTGNYLAITGTDGTGGYDVRVYAFNGTTLTECPGCNIDIGAAFQATWHPSGDYLAIGCWTNGTLRVYAFNYVTPGSESLTLAASVAVPGTGGYYLVHVTWSPDGLFCTIGGKVGGTELATIRSYLFNGSSLVEQLRARGTQNADYVHCVKYSPDYRFLAAAGFDSPHLAIYPVFRETLVEANSNVLVAYKVGALVTDNSNAIVTLSRNITPVAQLIYEDFYGAQHVADQFNGTVNATISDMNAVDADGQVKAASSAVVKFTNTTLLNDSGALISLNNRILADSNAIVNNSWSINRVIGLNTPLPLDVPVPEVVSRIEWSPDGKYLACPVSLGSTNNVVIYKRTTAGLQLVATANPGGRLYSVSWHPTGRYIAVTGWPDPLTKTLRIYSFEREQLADIGSVTSPSGEEMTGCSWHPSGAWLAVTDRGDGSILVASFDAATGTLGALQSLANFGGYTINDGPRVAAWSPYGNHLLVTGAGSTTGVTLKIYSFNVAVPSLTEVVSSSAGGALALMDSCWYASECIATATPSGSGQGAHLWRFNGTAITQIGFISVADCYGVAISNDNKLLALSQDGNIRLCRLDMTSAITEIVSARQTPGGTALRMRFSPDDALLAVGTQSPTALLVYPVSRTSFIEANSIAIKDLAGLEVANNNAITSLDRRLYEDSNALARIYPEVFPSTYGSPSRIYENSWAIQALAEDMNDGYGTLLTGPLSNSNAVVHIASDLAGNSSALVAHSWGLSIISGLNNPLIGTPTLNPSFGGECWSPDGKFLAVANFGASSNQLLVYRYDGMSLTLVATGDVGTSGVYGVAWHPTGKYIALAGAAGAGSYTLNVFSFDGAALSFVGSHASGGTILGLDWHPSGNYLLVVGYLDPSPIYLYQFNPTTGVLTTPPTLLVTRGRFMQVAKWSPNGTYFAISGNITPTDNNYAAYVYEFTPPATATFRAATTVGSTNFSRAAAWFSDSKHIIFAAYRGGDPVFAGFKIYTFDPLIGLTEIQSVPDPVGYGCQALALTHDDQFLVCGIRNPASICLYELRNYVATELVAARRTQGDAGDYAVQSLAFNPAENVLAAGDTNTPTVTERFKLYPVARNSLVTADSNALIAWSAFEWTVHNGIATHSWALSPITDLQPKGLYTNVHSLYATAWDPTGKFLAVGGSPASDDFEIYQCITDSTFISTFVPTGLHKLSLFASKVSDIRWHPAGRHIAVGGEVSNPDLCILRFTPTSIEPAISKDIDGATMTYGKNIAWRPGGLYLAVGLKSGATGGEVQVYSFDQTWGAETLTLVPGATATHGADIYSVEWSPDGQYLLVSGMPGTSSVSLRVYLFNGSSLTELPRCALKLGTARTVRALWSSTGRYVAVASASTGYPLNVYAFDGYNLRLLASYALGFQPLELAWSRSEASIVASGYGDNVKMFNFIDNQLSLRQKLSLDSASGWFYSLRFNPDESILPVGGNPGFYPCVVGRAANRVTAASNSIISAANYQLANSDALVTLQRNVFPSGYGSDAQVTTNSDNIISLSTPIAAASDNILTIDTLTNTDSNNLLTHSWAIWEANNLNGALTTPTAPDSVMAIHWSPDGSYMVTGGYGTTTPQIIVYQRLGNTFTQVAAASLGGTVRVRSVAWHPNGGYIAVGHHPDANNNTITLYSFSANTLTKIAAYTSSTAVTMSLDWHPSGLYLLAGENNSGAVKIYPFDPAYAYLAPAITLLSWSGEVWKVKWSADGTYFALSGGLVGSYQGAVYQFTVPSTATLKGSAVTGDSGYAVGIAWWPDNSRLAFTGGTGATGFFGFKIFTFNPSTGLTEVQSVSIAAGATKPIQLALTRDATALGVSFYGSTGYPNIRFYAIRNGLATEITAAQKFLTNDNVWALSFSPDDSLLAAGAYATVKLQIYPVARSSYIVSNSNAVVSIDRRQLADSSAIVRAFNEIWTTGSYLGPTTVLSTSNRSYETFWGSLALNDRLAIAESKNSYDNSGVDHLNEHLTTDEDTIDSQAISIGDLQSETIEDQGKINSIDTNIAHLYFSTATTLTYNLNLGLNHQLYLDDDLTLNGAGHTIKFPSHPYQVLNLANNVDAIIQNTCLDGFMDAQISRGSSTTLTFGDGTTVSLGVDHSGLSAPWYFSGNTTLEGNNHYISLSVTGPIVVQPGGHLTLSNVILTGVNGTNLRCANDTASITFHNVKLLAYDTYQFSAGSFDISSLLECQGPGTFLYSSIEASTILHDAEWHFSNGIIFSYAPTNTFDNRIYFTDSTSRLHLDTATLLITYTGLNLNTGTLVLSNKNYANISTVIDDDGMPLSFGTGTAAENLHITINTGGSLEITHGFVDYRNVETLS